MSLRATMPALRALLAVVERIDEPVGSAGARARDLCVALARSWQPEWQSAPDGEIGVARSVRRALERPRLPPELVYRRREKSRHLVLLLDATASSRFYDELAARLGWALASSGALLTAFTDRVRRLPRPASPAALRAELRALRPRATSAELGCLDLPLLGAELSRIVPAGSHLLVATDFVLCAEAPPIAPSAWARGLSAFASVSLVDTFPGGLLAGEEGWPAEVVEVAADELCDSSAADTLSWRQAETDWRWRVDLGALWASGGAVRLRVRPAAGAIVDALGLGCEPRGPRPRRTAYLPPRPSCPLGVRDLFVRLT
jgi:hypothetical protein